MPGAVDQHLLDDRTSVAELSDVIVALQELSAEELVAGGIHVDETWDEIDDPVLIGRDGVPVETWREGYPYDERMTRSEYEDDEAAAADRAAQGAALAARTTGGKLVVLFEGRDAAGKGGTIKRFMEHLNPRGATRRRAVGADASASGASGTSSATSRTCRRAARSCCSTAPGTTGPASSG